MRKIIIVAVLLAGVLIGGYIFVRTANVQKTADLIGSPLSVSTESPAVTLTPTTTKTANIAKVPVPLPTGNGQTTFIDEVVPWSLLLTDAACQLKGEIQFLNHNTYNNQDARFTYQGIDHPARNIFWTVTPADQVAVGPNMFGKVPLPDGESLLGVVLPKNPQYKKYEITAKIQYGRLVDAKGNFVTVGGYIKVFEKSCQGKTTVVLP